MMLRQYVPAPRPRPKHGPVSRAVNGNQISISDLDIGAAQAQITLSSRMHVDLERHQRV